MGFILPALGYKQMYFLSFLGALFPVFGVSYGIIRYQSFNVKTAAYHTALCVVGSVVLFSPLVLVPMVFDSFFLKPSIPNIIGWGLSVVVYCILLDKVALKRLSQIALRQRRKHELFFQEMAHEIEVTRNAQALQHTLWRVLGKKVYCSDLALVLENKNGVYKGHFESTLEEVVFDKSVRDTLSHGPLVITRDFIKQIDIQPKQVIHLIGKLDQDGKTLGY